MGRTAPAARAPGGSIEARCEDILRALADPTRLRIFRQLREGEACVCEIAAELDLAENLVSHHLRVFRKIGLVHDRRDPSDARWVYYHLSTPALSRISIELGAMFDPRTVGVRTPTCGPVAAREVETDDAARTRDLCCTR